MPRAVHEAAWQRDDPNAKNMVVSEGLL